MIDCIESQVQGEGHAFDVSLYYEELSWDGLDSTAEQFARVISLDADAWEQELTLHDELFTRLAHGLPQAPLDARTRLEECLGG